MFTMFCQRCDNEFFCVGLFGDFPQECPGCYRAAKAARGLFS